MSEQPRIVDVMGLRCPIPVQRTRMAIKDMEEGEILHVLGDDPESQHDIPALLERLGLQPAEISEVGSGWIYIILNRKK